MEIYKSVIWNSWWSLILNSALFGRNTLIRFYLEELLTHICYRFWSTHSTHFINSPVSHNDILKFINFNLIITNYYEKFICLINNLILYIVNHVIFCNHHVHVLYWYIIGQANSNGFMPQWSCLQRLKKWIICFLINELHHLLQILVDNK